MIAHSDGEGEQGVTPDVRRVLTDGL